MKIKQRDELEKRLRAEREKLIAEREFIINQLNLKKLKREKRRLEKLRAQESTKSILEDEIQNLSLSNICEQTDSCVELNELLRENELTYRNTFSLYPNEIEPLLAGRGGY